MQDRLKKKIYLANRECRATSKPTGTQSNRECRATSKPTGTPSNRECRAASKLTGTPSNRECIAASKQTEAPWKLTKTVICLGKTLRKLADITLDFIYPKRCAICDRTIIDDRGVCKWCEPKIRYVHDPTCMRCGKHLKIDSDMYCYDCKRSVKHYNRGFAVFEYEYIKESIFRFKYSGRAEYSRFYARVTAERLGDTLMNLGVEALVPVPIHRKRYMDRGYNQAYEYAKDLSKLMRIPVKSDWIIRHKNTVPLKKLSNQNRQKNLEKAFIVNRNDVKFNKVCIVDDIYTTGATIDRIARILKTEGVEKVYFVTIAIGKGL